MVQKNEQKQKQTAIASWTTRFQQARRRCGVGQKIRRRKKKKSKSRRTPFAAMVRLD